MIKESKTNKEIIKEIVEENNMTIGCWDNKMEIIPQDELKRVLKVIGYGSCDVYLNFNNTDYVVSYDDAIDDECDFALRTRLEYEKEFSEIEEEDWQGKRK